MYEKRFSPWTRWCDRDKCEGLEHPGVYAIALRLRRPTKRQFSWLKDIVYIGMTNSLGGLRARLRQFDRTMAGKLSHGGADRVLFKNPDYSRFLQTAYVAVAPFKCNPSSRHPRDLRIMGDVARFEFRCFAEYAAKFGDLPAFNKPTAAKASRTKRSSAIASRPSLSFP
jgi:hypothetical protein